MSKHAAIAQMVDVFAKTLIVLHQILFNR